MFAEQKTHAQKSLKSISRSFIYDAHAEISHVHRRNAYASAKARTSRNLTGNSLENCRRGGGRGGRGGGEKERDGRQTAQLIFASSARWRPTATSLTSPDGLRSVLLHSVRLTMYIKNQKKCDFHSSKMLWVFFSENIISKEEQSRLAERRNFISGFH